MKKDNPAAVYTKQGGREEREGSTMVREGRPVSSSLSSVPATTRQASTQALMALEDTHTQTSNQQRKVLRSTKQD